MKNPEKVRADFGVVFQQSVLDKALTPRDNLTHRASLYGIMGKECKDRIDYLSEILDFADDYGTHIKINIGGKEFIVSITDVESAKELKKIPNLSDGQYSTVDTIVALRKLADFLELSINIGFAKDVLY